MGALSPNTRVVKTAFNSRHQCGYGRGTIGEEMASSSKSTCVRIATQGCLAIVSNYAQTRSCNVLAECRMWVMSNLRWNPRSLCINS